MCFFQAKSNLNLFNYVKYNTICRQTNKNKEWYEMNQRLKTLVIVVMLFVTSMVLSSANQIIIKANDQAINYTEETGAPFIDENGRSLVPLRSTLEALGLTIGWDQDKYAAIVYRGNDVVTVPIGKKVVIHNGNEINLDTSAQIVNSRTYVPIRAIVEALGGTVEWDGVTKATNLVLEEYNEQVKYEEIPEQLNNRIYELINLKYEDTYSLSEKAEYHEGAWKRIEHLAIVDYKEGSKYSKYIHHSVGDQYILESKTYQLKGDYIAYQNDDINPNGTVFVQKSNEASLIIHNGEIVANYEKEIKRNQTFDYELIYDRFSEEEYLKSFTGKFYFVNKDIFIEKIELENPNEEIEEIKIIIIYQRIDDEPSQSHTSNYETDQVNTIIDDTNKSNYRVGLVTDISGISNNNFGNQAWSGIREYPEKVIPSYLDPSKEEDYQESIEIFVDEGMDLIVATSFLIAGDFKNVAEDYPNQKMAIIDMTYGEGTPENVLTITFKEQEAAFLAGYIAGKMTETNKVGFIGGIDYYVINKYEYGFLAGVSYANPNCEILVQYANSFNDSDAGYEVANRLYDQGADIIYHTAGNTAEGIFKAAQEQALWAIGCDFDESESAPDNVLTSTIKRFDIASTYILDMLVNNQWQSGKNIELGIAEGAIGIAENSNKHVPQSILDEVETIKELIANGTIIVPENREEYRYQFGQ